MSEYTHAGGVVYRVVEGQPQYLIVTAKKNPEHWVLPKGHIECGETPEAAAIREVTEETGIEANITGLVGAIEFKLAGEYIRAVFFLMEAGPSSAGAEDRRQQWCCFDEALKLVTFDDSRELLAKADQLVSGAS